MFMVAPGDCSPSRRVVSKILTISRPISPPYLSSAKEKGLRGLPAALEKQEATSR
jgi:hypothetical protein